MPAVPTVAPARPWANIKHDMATKEQVIALHTQVPDYPGRSGSRHKSLISFAPSHDAGDVAWRAMQFSSRMV